MTTPTNRNEHTAGLRDKLADVIPLIDGYKVTGWSEPADNHERLWVEVNGVEYVLTIALARQ